MSTAQNTKSSPSATPATSAAFFTPSRPISGGTGAGMAQRPATASA